MSGFHLKFDSRSLEFSFFSLTPFPSRLQSTLIVTTADSDEHKSDAHEHVHNTLCALLHGRMTLRYFTEESAI
jgi:hypothetical protein